jgi:hypothetical protein
MPEFRCNLCIYETQRDWDEDEQAERETLTVINGQMVCMAHLGYASGLEHSRMIQAMRRDS